MLTRSERESEKSDLVRFVIENGDQRTNLCRTERGILQKESVFFNARAQVRFETGSIDSP